jgi:hypothetical protein
MTCSVPMRLPSVIGFSGMSDSQALSEQCFLHKQHAHQAFLWRNRQVFTTPMRSQCQRVLVRSEGARLSDAIAHGPRGELSTLRIRLARVESGELARPDSLSIVFLSENQSASNMYPTSIQGVSAARPQRSHYIVSVVRDSVRPAGVSMLYPVCIYVVSVVYPSRPKCLPIARGIDLTAWCASCTVLRAYP